MERGIASGNFTRAVGAAIVDQRVVPVLIRLAQNALYAFGEIFASVVKRSDDADAWCGRHCRDETSGNSGLEAEREEVVTGGDRDHLFAIAREGNRRGHDAA